MTDIYLYFDSYPEARNAFFAMLHAKGAQGYGMERIEFTECDTTLHFRVKTTGRVR